MDYRSLHMKTVADLRRIAKEAGVKVPAGTNKALMVEIILGGLQARAADAVQAQAEEKTTGAETMQEAAPAPKRGRPRKTPVRQEAAVQQEEAQKQEEAQSAAPEVQEAPAVPEIQADAQDGEKAARPVYQRPLSTQQRMGARTQPVQGGYRPQQGRVPARFNTETSQARPQRSFETQQGSYRRMQGTENLVQQGGYRRTAAPQPAESAAPVQAAETQIPRREFNSEAAPVEDRINPGVPELLANGDCGDGAGILEIHPEGYGFLRAENYLPGNKDVYVSAAQIRRFNLRTGDYVVGKTRANQAGDRSVGLIYINEINGQTLDMARSRRFFDTLVPVYPNERLRMEREGVKDNSLRLVDMIAPIGKGQRGMIVSPPKAGKTTLLKKIANAITANNPDVHLIVLLIDERPEEVTDMKRSIQGEVVYSTFDEAPENHTRVSEMVLERAQRLVELGKDVVVLLDSITRLARAYNLVIPPTGRSLSGGLDPGALFRPKRFFGAARNIENGGSLTIIATALVDTGSRMDDVIFEEFKGTGNMELHLDRSLSDRRIFPAIDLYKSGTRREELLLTPQEQEGANQVRRMLSKGSPQEAAEQLISLMDKTKTNQEFYQKFKGWMNVCEKDGFSMR